MKVNQLVASVQRLQMVKNKSRYKASVNHKDEELKHLWLELSKEVGELLEIYNNADSSNGKEIVVLYNKEWQLYLKMKVLNNKIRDDSLKRSLDNVNLTKQDRMEAYKHLFVDDEEWINSFLEDNKKEDK